MLTGLAPLVSAQTRVLVLGSFPGAASLAAQQYYAHPRNHFWPIVITLLASSPEETSAASYQKRSEWLLSRGVGVWDVYAACEREGSLDTAIHSAEVNDFAGLLRCCPQLQAITHNGGESFKHAKRVHAALVHAGTAERRAGPSLASTAPEGLEPAAPNLLEQVWTGDRGEASREPRPARPRALHEVKSVGVQFYKLPSTSPANASWSFERKLAAWREVFEKHELI